MELYLSNGFQQSIPEEDSQAMAAIATHVGILVYRQVPFGIKCIPENFQKIMEETLSGLLSTAVFADDICVTCKDRTTYLANLRVDITFTNMAYVEIEKIRAFEAAPRPPNVLCVYSLSANHKIGLSLITTYNKTVLHRV
ncbi:Uncharacterized protein K02A2.6 [Eumeta japonica]|uniref:Uncharacterized protein K02A2.6 n=1 Tax=Eumeta variegata TaxID=151549 RepID=A0A4C1VGH4_EUMVA|nr:Uncharacterized protein K02A2.6 [Eumeta japonica]